MDNGNVALLNKINSSNQKVRTKQLNSFFQMFIEEVKLIKFEKDKKTNILPKKLWYPPVVKNKNR